MNIDRIDPTIRATWENYGPSVAITLAESFEGKYGLSSPLTIVAKHTLRSLMGETGSPLELSNELFKNARVSIPGRSSGEPRRKGRSIDRLIAL